VLTSIVPRLRCAQCQEHDVPLELTAFVEGRDGHIQDGILKCRRCSTWFPIQDNLLELVERRMLDAESLALFEQRFSAQLAASVGAKAAASSVPEEETPQMKQRRHFDWFASDATQNYDEYQRSAFWRAADAAAFGRWTRRISDGACLLDVGCANGRSAWPFAGTGATIVGCDISRRLIAQAIDHAKRRGLHSRTTFLVADADRLPFAAEAFDFVITYGALHHLPNPAGTSRDIQRVVKVGGVHFGSENNKSAFRRLFDLMMKLKPLWIEEAGTEPLISAKMLREWLADVPASLHIATHVFVPPHLINALPAGWGARLLNFTDAIGSRLPIVRDNGGLIVFEARKMANAAR
jgi:2-polyprenyl-3-methyl-5-hydroxy-6-metoxy-1,4-benzoquinol methylase